MTYKVAITLHAPEVADLRHRPMMVLADLRNRGYTPGDMAEVAERMIAEGTRKEDFLLVTITDDMIITPASNIMLVEPFSPFGAEEDE